MKFNVKLIISRMLVFLFVDIVEIRIYYCLWSERYDHYNYVTKTVYVVLNALLLV